MTVNESDFGQMTMKVMRLSAFGGPEVFESAVVDLPTPDPHEFLVRVAACGVCGHDVLSRTGQLSATIGGVLGHEISGRVHSVGSPNLAEWVGKRVALVQRRPCGACAECEAGLTSHCRNGPGFYGDDVQGGYAEFVIASPLNAVEVPDSIDDVTASVLSCAVGTGLHALRQAEVGGSDVVLITGAGGGVGTHAVQLASLLGVRVIATTSSAGKVDKIREAGADVVLVNPTSLQIRAATTGLGRPRGADACLEITGAPQFATSLRSLAPRGRLVLIGNVVPGMLELDPGLTILKELRILGSAHANRDELADVIDLVASGKIRPVVSQTFSLDEISHAHLAHDANQNTGRIVLIP